jgi:hypothetical protein
MGIFRRFKPRTQQTASKSPLEAAKRIVKLLTERESWTLDFDNGLSTLAVETWGPKDSQDYCLALRVRCLQFEDGQHVIGNGTNRHGKKSLAGLLKKSIGRDGFPNNEQEVRYDGFIVGDTATQYLKGVPKGSVVELQFYWEGFSTEQEVRKNHLGDYDDHNVWRKSQSETGSHSGLTMESILCERESNTKGNVLEGSAGVYGDHLLWQRP